MTLSRSAGAEVSTREGNEIKSFCLPPKSPSSSGDSGDVKMPKPRSNCKDYWHIQYSFVHLPNKPLCRSLLRGGTSTAGAGSCGSQTGGGMRMGLVIFEVANGGGAMTSPRPRLEAMRELFRNYGGMTSPRPRLEPQAPTPFERRSFLRRMPTGRGTPRLPLGCCAAAPALPEATVW